MSEHKNFALIIPNPPLSLVYQPSLIMNLDPVFWLSSQTPINASASRFRGVSQLTATQPNSPSSATPDKATFTDLTPLHKLHSDPSMKRYLVDMLEPMSMHGATPGIVDMWNRLLQDHTKEAGDRLHARDYIIVEAVSPYYPLHPTSASAWFVTEPGLAGRNSPSGESRLTTGVALCLKDRTVGGAPDAVSRARSRQ